MNTRQHDRRCLSPKAAGWWSRLLVAGVFAFYLTYVPIHLATAAHVDDMLESVAELVFHHDDDRAGDHDSDHHFPHPPSDHTLTLPAQTQAHGAVALAVLLPADVLMVLFQAPTSPLPPVFERLQPPGESPPGPLQPRAPPLA